MSSPANALPALPNAAPATSATDRRAFLATLAAAGVMTGAAVPAFAAGVDHPDAKLLDLVAQHGFHTAQLEEFDRLVEEALDRLVSPEIPEALFWRKRDHLSVCFDRRRLTIYLVDGEERHVYDGRRCFEFLAEHVAELRADPGMMPSGRYVVDRYDELVAATDEWEAANRRSEDEAGYTDPSLCATREHDIINGLVHGITLMPALTADGAAAKARVAASLYYSGNSAARRIEGLLNISDARAAISLSLIVDAMKLGTGTQVAA